MNKIGYVYYVDPFHVRRYGDLKPRYLILLHKPDDFFKDDPFIFITTSTTLKSSQKITLNKEEFPTLFDQTCYIYDNERLYDDIYNINIIYHNARITEKGRLPDQALIAIYLQLKENKNVSKIILRKIRNSLNSINITGL
jgi:hypothetical protein